MLRTKLLLIVVVVIFGAKAVNAQGDLSAREIARRSLPSVVLIICDDSNEVALGSGFFIRPGVLVTNYHVIAGMNRGMIQVAVGTSKEKRIFRIARVIAFDTESDLALLSVPASKETYVPSLSLAPESYEFEVGETIYALGNPEGLVGTMSPGIVSAGMRSSQKRSRIQITAPISHGSSGGPIVNGQGKVIGVAVSTLSEGQNLNFAVPVALLHELARTARFPDKNQEILDTLYDSRNSLPKPWRSPLPAGSDISTASDESSVRSNSLTSRSKLVSAPRSATDFFFRALAHFQAGRFAAAVADNSTALKLNPHLVPAYINRGISNGNLRNFKAEITDYTKAISLNPTLFQAFHCRGFRYLMQGNLNLAIADFDQALRLNPDYVLSYLYRGRAHYLNYSVPGTQDLAIADFEAVLRIEPQNSEAYLGIGIAQQNKGNFKLAASAYSKAIALDPRQSKAHYNRGILFFEGPDWEFAIADFTRAIQIDPLFTNAYTMRARTYQNHKKYALAIADFSSALAIDSKDANVIIWRSYAYCELGNIKLAIADQKRAKQLGEIYFENCRPEH